MSRWDLEEITERKEKETEALPSLKKPKMYKVILLNDDYTPMDFVVKVLKKFFYLGNSVAVQVMLRIHVTGQAVCGIFTKDIAETKVVLVNEYSNMHEHPLRCVMEPE